MIKGTRILLGAEATRLTDTILSLRAAALKAGFEELILPSIWEPQPWIERSGTEIEGQLWHFQDKGNPPRPVTLIPEATAIVQQLYEGGWRQSKPKPVRVFYSARCYRYERPQEGRYREFNQFGVEILGPDPQGYEEEAKALLRQCLDASGVRYEWNGEAARGLSYYTRQGFEAACPLLGAQKQVAGGGTYAQGCGWAIGVDRLVLALSKQD